MPPFDTLTGDQLPGWTVTSGSVDVVGQRLGALRWAAVHRFSRKPEGALEQSFATVAGETYPSPFQCANNIGISTATANVAVLGVASLLNHDLTHSGSPFGAMNYTALPILR